MATNAMEAGDFAQRVAHAQAHLDNLTASYATKEAENNDLRQQLERLERDLAALRAKEQEYQAALRAKAAKEEETEGYSASQGQRDRGAGSRAVEAAPHDRSSEEGPGGTVLLRRSDGATVTSQSPQSGKKTTRGRKRKAAAGNTCTSQDTGRADTASDSAGLAPGLVEDLVKANDTRSRAS